MWALLQEQQQLCAALQETKVLLEEQLADARARCSSLRELERDSLLLRQRITDVEAVGVVSCLPLHLHFIQCLLKRICVSRVIPTKISFSCECAGAGH